MHFADLLQQRGVDFRKEGHEHCRPGWLQLDCPQCSAGWGHYRLGYCIAYPHFNCWSCGALPLIRTLGELIGVSYQEARALTESLSSSSLPKEVHKGKLELPFGLGPLTNVHQDYLLSRHLDWREIQDAWGIKGIGPTGRYPWSIWIPVHLNRKIVSWTTRRACNQGSSRAARYRSAGIDQESVPHKTLLYGEDAVNFTIIVCEGPIDVWRIGAGAVATFGTGYSRSQLLRMIRYPRRVICFDSEPAAQRVANQLLTALEVFPGESYNVVLESGKDPGEASPQELKELRKRFLR